MQIKINLIARLFVFLVIGTMTMLIVLASRQERSSSLPIQNQEQARQKARGERLERDENTLPEIDYRTFETNDETPREIRRARNKRYNAWGKPFEDYEMDVAQTKMYCSWSAPEVEAFPAKESSLIVIGTVTGAKGYLSEDRSAAYSEYRVMVTDVLKGENGIINNQIIAEREGAKVLLPTGRKIIYWVMKQGTPQIGHRYLLFLKNTPEGKDYFILTGYELANGRVEPLDSISGKYELFEGNEETAFIEIVRSTLK